MKVRGGFFSIGCSGKFADSLVAFQWKDTTVIRKLVYPAQPNTPLQVAQKNYMALTILAFQTIIWTEQDYDAWRKLASIRVKGETGPNQFTREYIRVLRIPDTWSILYHGLAFPQAGFDQRILAYGDAGLVAVRFRHGLRPHVLINDVPNTAYSAPYWHFDIPSGSYAVGDRVYFQAYDGANWDARIGQTGIYYFDMV